MRSLSFSDCIAYLFIDNVIRMDIFPKDSPLSSSPLAGSEGSGPWGGLQVQFLSQAPRSHTPPDQAETEKQRAKAQDDKDQGSEHESTHFDCHPGAQRVFSLEFKVSNSKIE